MTATTPPIDAFIDPMAPSLASLLEALAALDLPPRRVADLASAVRSLCRVLGKAPVEVPADPGVLGRLLRRALPATAGIKPGRWANIKSLVLQALALTGCRVMPGRSLHPLTPAWAALMALLPTKYDRAGLSRLMHFCAGQGIPPAAVDQAVFDRFGAAILQDSFIRNQRVAHQTAARLWHRAVEQIPGWPPTRIAQPRYAKPYVLPLDRLPGLVPGGGCRLARSARRCRCRSRRGRCGRCGRARSSSGASTCARRPRPWCMAAVTRRASPALAIWSRSRRCRRSCASSWRAAATGRPRRSMASPPI